MGAQPWHQEHRGGCAVAPREPVLSPEALQHQLGLIPALPAVPGSPRAAAGVQGNPFSS